MTVSERRREKDCVDALFGLNPVSTPEILPGRDPGMTAPMSIRQYDPIFNPTQTLTEQPSIVPYDPHQVFMGENFG
jgi:hypothetical protein